MKKCYFFTIYNWNNFFCIRNKSWKWGYKGLLEVQQIEKSQ